MGQNDHNAIKPKEIKIVFTANNVINLVCSKANTLATSIFSVDIPTLHISQD